MWRLLYRFLGSFFIIILFLTIHLPLFAQSTALVLHQANTDSFPTMNVIISTWDGSRPITDLQLADLTLSEDGQILPIEDVMPLDGSQIPVSLILVLDTSTSMQANNAINDAKAAAISILDRLKPDDRVALIAFGGEIDRNVDVLDPTRELAFTTDKEQVRTLINGLQANGPTPLYDATVKGIRMSANEALGSRAIILLSDGRDQVLINGVSQQASVLTADDAVNEARAASMPIFTIGLGSSIDRPFLERLADQSGGQFNETPTPDQLNMLFNQALDGLLQRKVIRYQSNALPDGEAHALQVQFSKDGLEGSNQITFVASLPETPIIQLNYTDNQQVEGDVTIEPTIFARDDIVNVQLLVDGEVVGETTTGPYALTWASGDARWQEQSNHTISVRATDGSGDVGEQGITLIISPSISITPEPEPAATVVVSEPAGEENGTSDGATGNEEEGTSPENGATGSEEEGTTGNEEEGTSDDASPIGPDVPNNPSWIPATLFQFMLSNRLSLSLLGLAALLLIGVLLIWMRDRNRSTDNIINHRPPPPTPVPLPPARFESNRGFSPPPYFTDNSVNNSYDDHTVLDESPPLPQDPATSSSINPTLVDEADGNTYILGKRQRQTSLRVMEGSDNGKTFDLLEEKMIIGRGTAEKGKIALTDRTVSRQQAIIKIEDEEYYLYNRSNSNLTYLNGQEVKARMQLYDRDKIEIGNTVLQFIDHERG